MAVRGAYWAAGLMIAAAVIYLITSNTSATARYYLTVTELQQMGETTSGRAITVSGAPLGDSILYDASAPRAEFSIAHTPLDPRELRAAGGLEAAWSAAVRAPAAPRLHVVYDNVKPDMLRDEHQAVVRGRLGDDGRLYADQVLLRCPSRYQEAGASGPAEQPAAAARDLW